MRKFYRYVVALCLKLEAKLYLWRFRPTVIGVAGIGNKTATKRAIVDELQRRHLSGLRVHPKCYNTDIGLPLAILMVDPPSYSTVGWLRTLFMGARHIISSKAERPRVMILEYGVSQAGDMQALINIVSPDIAVITDITEHPQSRVTATELSREMAVLVTSLKTGDSLVINGDMPLASDITRHTPPRVVIRTYGLQTGNQYRAESIKESHTGFSYLFRGQSRNIDKFGEHQLYASLAALAVADSYHEI